jgi:hypothetical protein
MSVKELPQTVTYRLNKPHGVRLSSYMKDSAWRVSIFEFNSVISLLHLSGLGGRGGQLKWG